jgi:hypothetical protein
MNRNYEKIGERIKRIRDEKDIFESIGISENMV